MSVKLALKKGLQQLPTEGLQQLIDWIDSGKPLLLNGQICNDAGVG